MTGGWAAVQRAIETCNPFQTNEAEYNAFFEKHHDYMLASVAFTFRMIRELLFGWLYFNKKFPPEFKQKTEDNALVCFNRFIQALNNQLDTSEIKTRSYFENFLADLPDLDKVGIITTNWDQSLWNNPLIKNLIQLHGRVKKSWLLLPTEISTEENTKIEIIKQESLFEAFKKN